MLISSAAWQKLILGWYKQMDLSPGPTDSTDSMKGTLRAALVAASCEADRKSEVAVSDGNGRSVHRRETMVAVSIKEDDLFDLKFEVAVTSLLVVVHVCLAKDQWLALLPRMWAACGSTGQDTKAVSLRDQ